MTSQKQKPWFKDPEPAKNSGTVAIIGGGIAGLTLAMNLNHEGFQVTIIEKNNRLLSAASGNPAAILEPYLTIGNSVHQEFYGDAYPFAIDHYSNLGDGIFQNCGLKRIAKDEEEQEKFIKFQKIYPDDFLTLSNDTIHFKDSGYLIPEKLLDKLPESVNVLTRKLAHYIKRKDNKWRVMDENYQLIIESDILIIANAYNALKFKETNHLPLDKVSGQITFTKPQQKIKEIISSSGYFIPNIETRDGPIDVLGATFERDEINDITDTAHAENLEKSSLSEKSSEIVGGRRSNRAMVHDHLPIVGAVPDYDFYSQEYSTLHHGSFHQKWKDAKYHPGLYICAGLGARGFLSAPLLSEYISNLITGKESKFSERVRHALHPARFIIRKLSKK